MFQSLTPKQRVPEGIQREMARWRVMMFPMPMSYIEFHRERAWEELEALRCQRKLKIHATVMHSDGWCDGMQAVQADVETPLGKRMKLQWHDGNQGFMKKLDSGWGIMDEEDLL